MRTFLHPSKTTRPAGATFCQVALAIIAVSSFVVCISTMVADGQKLAAKSARPPPTLHSFTGEPDTFTPATFREFSGTVAFRGGFLLARCELADGRTVLALPGSGIMFSSGDKVELWRFSWSPEPGSVLTSLIAMPAGSALWPPKKP